MVDTMESKENWPYLQIAMPAEVKAKVRAIAKEERRSMSQQAGELLELGLAEYARREKQAADVADGKTQISREVLDGRR